MPEDPFLGEDPTRRREPELLTDFDVDPDLHAPTYSTTAPPAPAASPAAALPDSVAAARPADAEVDPDRAAEIAELLRVGATAFGGGELASALDSFDRAARLASRAPVLADLRARARCNAASVSDELGDHAAAIAGFGEAITWWAGMADGSTDLLRAGALVNLSQALQHVGEPAEAQGALEQARDLLMAATSPTPGVDHGALLLSCLLSLTAVAMHQRRYADAGRLAREALDVAGRVAPDRTGHPLATLAAVHHETGRVALAEDFARQALTAFEAADNPIAAAESRQNLAIMYLQRGLLDEAAVLLADAERFFARAGMAHHLAMGLKLSGFLAGLRDDRARSTSLFLRSLRLFEDHGAVVEAAEVRLPLATAAVAEGRYAEGEAYLTQAYAVYAARGLTAACAQLDVRHALLLEHQMAREPHSIPALLPRALTLAVPAALAVDAVRFTLVDGHQRAQWRRQVAEPALSLAFRLAEAAGDGHLVAELVESQCAGSPLADTEPRGEAGPVLPSTLLDVPSATAADPAADAAGPLQLGAALAGVAAGAGIRVAPPPRLAVTEDGVVALAAHLARATARYGGVIRATRVIPAW
ncbi:MULTISPECIES: tetratricopeptide repeat protein [Actinoalloteichus]|uniref:Tetratricopeptide repeat protein n=1 Tax=Actinoalloteichus fjordicus TaxID=1612552 RepID=A0AAC9LG91_9PSEU|nr:MULTISPECIES: tetratricopeptide repeat protein [Actinoalloteichus]APU15704.1 hypothetical protein UA74_18380 [Actinoalloteichus fjordicus]APU21764.1 hypothetical protein UA75_18870 [Actinoalloteichus sp. GBA129-24]